MADAILVLNAGSSSLKFSLYANENDGPRGWLRGQIEGLYTAPKFSANDVQGALLHRRDWKASTALGHEGAIDFLLEFLQQELSGRQLIAVGHRVVHGGMQFTAPVHIDAQVIAELDRLIPLAPLHQPHNLQSIRAIAQRAPELAQVACLDTAFHRAQEPIAQAFALPPAITDRGVRRYGFHGLSYEYIAYVLPRYDAAAARGRVECVERHARIAGKRWAARKAGDRSFLPIAFGASEVRWQPPSADWMRWSLPAASASTR